MLLSPKNYSHKMDSTQNGSDGGPPVFRARSNTDSKTPADMETPRYHRSRSLGALLFSQQQLDRLASLHEQSLDGGSLSPCESVEDVSQADSTNTAGNTGGTQPSGIFGFAGKLGKRRSSLFTQPDTVSSDTVDARHMPARKTSENSLWKWFTTPSTDADKTLAPTGKAPSVSNAKFDKYDLLKNITQRDINAISRSDW